MLLIGCSKYSPEPATTKSDSPVVAPIVVDAALDAAIDAPPRSFASLEEFARHVLAQPLRDEPIAIAGWEHNARAVVRDGKVTHVVFEVWPTDANVMLKFGEITSSLAKALGTAKLVTGRPSWRTDKAQLFVGLYDGFLRGTPSLVIDVLPPGETHVCGKDDGFAAFFAKFRKALVAGDEKALATMIAVEPNSDLVTSRPPLSRLPPKPECHLSREQYLWRTIEVVHGGDYWRFAGGPDNWFAYGPYFIGHDDDPNISAP